MMSVGAYRWTALIVYLVICIFDFMIVPIWFGFMRPDYAFLLNEVRSIEDTMVQMELMVQMVVMEVMEQQVLKVQQVMLQQ